MNERAEMNLRGVARFPAVQSIPLFPFPTPLQSLKPRHIRSMRFSAVLAIVLANVGVRSLAQRASCPSVPSCSDDPDHKDIDPCCVPSPGGLFIFKQRLQLDVADEMGNWGIDGLDVLGYVILISFK